MCIIRPFIHEKVYNFYLFIPEKVCKIYQIIPEKM